MLYPRIVYTHVNGVFCNVIGQTVVLPMGYRHWLALANIALGSRRLTECRGPVYVNACGSRKSMSLPGLGGEDSGGW
jgi:hypothetical protein